MHYIYASLIGPTLAVLTSHCFLWPEKAMQKADLGYLPLFYHCVRIVHECIYNTYKMHSTCAEMVGFPKSTSLV